MLITRLLSGSYNITSSAKRYLTAEQTVSSKISCLQLILHWGDKMFSLDAHERQISWAMVRRRASCATSDQGLRYLFRNKVLFRRWRHNYSKWNLIYTYPYQMCQGFITDAKIGHIHKYSHYNILCEPFVEFLHVNVYIIVRLSLYNLFHANYIRYCNNRIINWYLATLCIYSRNHVKEIYN